MKVTPWVANNAVPDCFNREYGDDEATCFVRLDEGVWWWEVWCLLTSNRYAGGETPTKETAQAACDSAAAELIDVIEESNLHMRCEVAK